jgi:YD repeat-containing protein
MKKIRIVVLLAQTTALFGYQYYQSDTFSSLNSSNWTFSTGAAVSSQGLYAALYAVSNLAVPDYSSEYEVKTTLAFGDNSQGDIIAITYLRVLGNLQNQPFEDSFHYSVETDVSSSTGSCHYTVYKRAYAQTTQLAQGTSACHNGSTMRVMVHSPSSVDAQIEIFFDDLLQMSVVDYSGITSGLPGVGIYSCDGCGAISRVDIGVLDHVAPNLVSSGGIGTSIWANRMDAQWQPATDDSIGIGVAHYALAKNGGIIGWTASPSYSDQTLIPGVTYVYTLYTIDFHGNWSAGTNFNVTTPGVHPNFAIPTPPARTGIRPTGAYWGAGGEQIDMLSGNLNWTLPLLKAQGRSGWSAGFNLNYNSQLWRQDSGGTWNLGMDVGYGYGWRLMAGAVVPYWSDPYTIDHYIYIDSTGADYKLNVNTNGIWTSAESVYVAYDPANLKLMFNDGSFWIMSCESGGNEPDIGVRYPTRMQDTNGNQVIVHYMTGQGAISGETSARVASIEDIRSHPEFSHPYSYVFNYNSDATPHLVSITNYIDTNESYTFTYLANQTISSPFGYDPGSQVTAPLLQKVTNGNAMEHNFEYSGGSGEMSRVVLPYGASLRWVYRNFTFSASGSARTVREVQYRYLAPSTGAAEALYVIFRDANDSNLTWHTSASLADATNAGKVWAFTNSPSPSVWWNGLLYSYLQQQVLGQTILRRQDFSWVQDPAGNPYIGSALTVLDPGTANEKQMQSAQTLDAHGNVTVSSIYGFGSGTSPQTTPSRTYTTTYLNSTPYTTRNIWNRPTGTTVTNGSQTTTVGLAGYDDYGSLCGQIPNSLVNITGQRLHDPGNYGTSFFYRGNLSSRTTLAGSDCMRYDITGAVRGTAGPGGAASMTSSAVTNYAAPVAITANNYTTTLTYTNFLAVSSVTGQNTEVASVAYNLGQPVQTTSPHGAVTNILRTYNPPQITETTNQHWVRTTLDGLGRPIKVERGDGGTTRSVVDTEYAPCACSPIGKLKRVSQPYAPGGTVYWTTYTYDGLGRTLTVTAPDGAVTSYSYQANKTTVTDPAGKWKTYLTDAMGNLTQVIEPDPGGGANWNTNYTYDLLNHLTQVSMPRPTGTQTRTFNYVKDGSISAFLQSATNPENGTVSYTYTADGQLATKTDAKGQKIAYTWDGYKRLTMVQRYPSPGTVEDPCQRVTYFYDGDAFSGTFSLYPWGRRTGVEYNLAGCNTQLPAQFRERYSYTKGGLVEKKRLTVTMNANPNGYNVQSVNLDTAQTYDNEGKVLTVKYPDAMGFDINGTYTNLPGATYTYTYDAMARPITMVDDSQSPVNWVTNVQYGAANELKQMDYRIATGMVSNGKLGYGGYYTESRQYNSRMQMTRLTIPGALDMEYRAGARVLIVTSSDSQRDREEMDFLGADGYFRKPSEFSDLMKVGELVRDLLARKGCPRT